MHRYGLFYGPYRSARLGASMGVDLTPLTCTFDCVYCERGRTVYKLAQPGDLPVTVDRATFAEKLAHYRAWVAARPLESLTFAGTGEPTLDLRLGAFIRTARDEVPDVPVRVMTNASLLARRDVRVNLSEADEVIVKLNAASERAFQEIHRPCDLSLTVRGVIRGILAVKSVVAKLTVEVLLLDSRFPRFASNADARQVARLAEALRVIQPHQVQLHTVRRRPAEPHVRQVRAEVLASAASRLRRDLPGRVSVYA